MYRRYFLLAPFVPFRVHNRGIVRVGIRKHSLACCTPRSESVFRVAPRKLRHAAEWKLVLVSGAPLTAVLGIAQF